SWTFIVLIDLCTVLFLVWNFDYALKVPFFGRMLAWIERRGHNAVERYKWIRRLAFFGLTFYALLPLEGTGAIGGSVVGRAIGLSPFRTFLAVVLGSIIRTTYITLFALGLVSALHL
ncbi:MAG: small multi-drug export protein, partial [Halobacteriales archaeon]|nr:small multi-drug export protein [Halobacteriales archaeon]